jgi:hypothetical protein
MSMPAVHEPTLLERALASLPDDPVALARVLESADWDRLSTDAREHGLFTLLAHECDRNGVALPPRVRDERDRHHAIASVWHAHLLAALDALGEIFSIAAVPVVALKGPLLAERIYPDGALRPCVDLDLLVAEHDLERSTSALEAAGWRVETGPAATYSRQHHHHLQFRREGQPPLELHFRARVAFGGVLEAEELISSSSPGDGRGRGLKILEPEDEFVYLAVHAAAHGYVRLMWLYDLKLLCRRYLIRWSRVATRARAVRMQTAVAFTCEMLRERLSVSIEDLPELRLRGLRPRFARRVQERVARHEGLLALDRLGGLAFTSLLCDRPISGFGLWTHHAAHVLKRRMQRRLPSLVPADWAG